MSLANLKVDLALNATLFSVCEVAMLESERLDRHQSREQVVSTAEIAAAIEGLTTAQLLRLRSFARYRMRALGRRAMGRCYEDLLGEAYALTLSGVRRWNKGAVDLVGHLCGVMRSASSHWGELKAANFEGPDDYNVERGGLIERTETQCPDAERELAARQQVELILAFFVGDLLVLQIIEALKDGMKGPEAQLALGINQKEYETAMKRLRRGVERLAKRESMGGDDV